MAIQKKASDEAKKVSEIKVLKARFVKEGTYAIDIEVNGIKVYGCFYREGEKNGKEWSLVALPQTKGTDKDGATKYFDVVWFPISKAMVASVAEQIEELI